MVGGGGGGWCWRGRGHRGREDQRRMEPGYTPIAAAHEAATHTLQGMVSCTAVWRGTHPLDELYFFSPAQHVEPT